MSEHTKERCKEKIWDNSTGWGRFVQCSRYAVKDGYCKQHHPDSVAKREAESERRYQEKQARSPYIRIQTLAEQIVQITKQRDELLDALKKARSPIGNKAEFWFECDKLIEKVEASK